MVERRKLWKVSLCRKESLVIWLIQVGWYSKELSQGNTLEHLVFPSHPPTRIRRSSLTKAAVWWERAGPPVFVSSFSTLFSVGLQVINELSGWLFEEARPPYTNSFSFQTVAVWWLLPNKGSDTISVHDTFMLGNLGQHHFTPDTQSAFNSAQPSLLSVLSMKMLTVKLSVLCYGSICWWQAVEKGRRGWAFPLSVDLPANLIQPSHPDPVSANFGGRFFGEPFFWYRQSTVPIITDAQLKLQGST